MYDRKDEDLSPEELESKDTSTRAELETPGIPTSPGQENRLRIWTILEDI